MMFTDNSRGRCYTKNPAVVKLNGNYFMYYSLPPYNDGRLPDGCAHGIAVSTDLENWTIIGQITPENPYEENGISGAGAIRLGDRIHLFYHTYGNGEKDSLCHAWSDDGINFTRNPSNPIFRAEGDWNNGRAIDADLVVYKDKLLMYFATRDPSYKYQMLGVASAPLDSDFGKNCWKQECDKSILEPELPWEQECIEAPAVIYKDGKFYMFYGGAYNNAPQQIGCAESTDGVTWRRLFDEPLIPNGKPGEWNESESGHPFIFRDDDGRTYLFYQGNNDKGRSWYITKVEIGWKDGLPYVIS